MHPRHTAVTGQLLSRCVMAHTAHMRVGSVACDCGPSRAWRRVSQRADSEPPAGSSRFGRAAPSSGAIRDDAARGSTFVGFFRRIVGPASQLGRALPEAKGSTIPLTEAKNRQKRENEVAWLWRKKMTPALALAPKLLVEPSPRLTTRSIALKLSIYEPTHATSYPPQGSTAAAHATQSPEAATAATEASYPPGAAAAHATHLLREAATSATRGKYVAAAATC